MSELIIDPTQVNIYGVNSFINKFDDNKNDILDLQELKDKFKLDYEYDDQENEINKSDLPAFSQLTLNQRISTGTTDGSYSSSYNRPPLGPIENFCYCSYCSNIAPQFHTEDCPFPEKKSLFLTMEGIYYYIIQNKKETFSDNLNQFKQKWLNNQVTQSDLNNFLLVPNSVKVPNNSDSSKISLNDAFSKIQYFDVVKLRGPTKLEYTTATQKFSNAIMISYEYENKSIGPSGSLQDESEDILKKTSIRIYKNGLINLINVPSSKEKRENLYNNLITRINESSDDIVNLENFNKEAYEITDKEYDEYTIIPDISYIHSVNAQFNMWQVKDKYSINFRKLNDLISPFNSSGKIVSGEFTDVTISPNNSRQIIRLYYDAKSVQIVNWEHSLGRDTRNQSLTREEIKCTIIPIEGIKISLQIHKHGTFQMSMSYCNASDIKNGICSSVINKLDQYLDFRYFDIVKDIFVGILKEKEELISKSLDYSEESTGLIRNTVSGNAPPNKPGTSTAVCRSSDPRPGYPGLRPIPYSFQGKCPESRQYIDPIGVLGNDGLYYPCCAAKTKKSEEDYKKYLIDGFPTNASDADEYGVNMLEDKKSGILVPGSINVGAKTKAKINDEWAPVTIIGYKGKSKKPQEFLVQIIETGKVVTVNRSNLERDSRYFPGLKSFNKEQLIKCILKNLQYKKEDQTILELENLAILKDKINIPSPNFNPILSSYNLDIFKNMKYYVTSVPNSSNMYYLYISPTESFFINLYGNKKPKNLNEKINEEIILLGFLEEKTDKFFVTDILYFNKKITNSFSSKIELLKEIQETFFLTEGSIVFSEYYSNIIKSSRDLLIESSDIFLVYLPENNYTNFKIWTTTDIEPEITLQILKKTKTNYYKLGFNNSSLDGLILSFDSIFIPKAFVDNNLLKINDYVLFKFDYNLQTGQLGSRILNPIEKTEKPDLTLDETLIKISMIINPIKESFFLNNRLDDEFVWIIPNTDDVLKYQSDEMPLL